MKLSAILLAAIFSVSLLPGCKKNDTPAQNLPAETKANVAYGTDAQQKMDVYLPENRSAAATKVIIMIHGGGWVEGDKADFTPYVDTLKKRFPGWAIINMNYRLGDNTVTPNRNLFPTQEMDVKAAFEFIDANRNTYQISNKVVVLGASAGGHLSLLQGYKYNSPIKVKAIVNFFGPADMVAMYNDPASIFAPPASIAQLFGGTPATKADLYFQSSPINFITAQSPPTITLQGGVDILVKPSQQTALHQVLNSKNVVNELVIYPTENHGWTGSNLVNSFDRIQAFVNANVQ